MREGFPESARRASATARRPEALVGESPGCGAAMSDSAYWRPRASRSSLEAAAEGPVEVRACFLFGVCFFGGTKRSSFEKTGEQSSLSLSLLRGARQAPASLPTHAGDGGLGVHGLRGVLWDFSGCERESGEEEEGG